VAVAGPWKQQFPGTIFNTLQQAGPPDVGSSGNVAGPSSSVLECSGALDSNGRNASIGKVDIQNLTGVMFQILNHLDAQDKKIAKHCFHG
jgi:hypothetical protein